MNAHTVVRGANGMLNLQLPWWGFRKQFEFQGGPANNFPKDLPNAIGISLKEAPIDGMRYLPIPDFSIPREKEAVDQTLRIALLASLNGCVVYIGCGAGWGRTGLFLALLAKVCGVKDPVAYVRTNYTSRAVETEEQYTYVNEFDVSALRAWLAWEVLKHVIGFRATWWQFPRGA